MKFSTSLRHPLFLLKICMHFPIPPGFYSCGYVRARNTLPADRNLWGPQLSRKSCRFMDLGEGERGFGANTEWNSPRGQILHDRDEEALPHKYSGQVSLRSEGSDPFGAIGTKGWGLLQGRSRSTHLSKRPTIRGVKQVRRYMC